MGWLFIGLVLGQIVKVDLDVPGDALTLPPFGLEYRLLHERPLVPPLVHSLHLLPPGICTRQLFLKIKASNANVPI